MRKDVDAAIDQLLNDDIIERATGPTPWISPIVIVPKKSNEIRVCVDMREANQAIQHEKHPMPTIEEVITDLNGATLFSTLDLKAGYHQLHGQSCTFVCIFMAVILLYALITSLCCHFLTTRTQSQTHA